MPRVNAQTRRRPRPGHLGNPASRVRTRWRGPAATARDHWPRGGWLVAGKHQRGAALWQSGIRLRGSRALQPQSCECFAILREELDRLNGSDW